ncbi:hypothetical protein B0H11DRAFT_2144376 [Mycena galericulata]|nr:hypothetical protein B0H11DRAFT_2144376 [Mycena galericulata]
MMVVLQALMVFPWMGGLSGLRPYLQVSMTASLVSGLLRASKLWRLSVSIYMRWGIHCSTHYRDTSHSRWAPSDEAEYL